MRFHRPQSAGPKLGLLTATAPCSASFCTIEQRLARVDGDGTPVPGGVALGEVCPSNTTVSPSVRTQGAVGVGDGS